MVTEFYNCSIGEYIFLFASFSKMVSSFCLLFGFWIQINLGIQIAVGNIQIGKGSVKLEFPSGRFDDI